MSKSNIITWLAIVSLFVIFSIRIEEIEKEITSIKVDARNAYYISEEALDLSEKACDYIDC